MGETMYGEGTMTQEMAIRIEMEYRRKLAQKQQIPEAEFCKNLRPFGVQPPMSGPSHGSHQRPSFNATPPLPKLQGPNHDLKSSQPLISASSLRPCPSRTSDVSLEIPSRQQQGPNSQLETSQPVGLGNLQNHNDYTFCKICQVPCSGFANYTQHVEGRKHKNKKLGLDAGIADAGARETPRRWCETCKLWCMNEEQFQVHQGGKPHIQKLAAEKDNGKQLALVHGGPGKARNGGRHRCHLCNIGCIDSLSLEMHKNGKRHIAQLHQSQNKKTRI
ncbi:hypothetical protein LINGRAHAP2_LOCUS18233 [Linum grandiflorum]